MGEGLRCYTNGGPQELNMVGEINGYDTVWHNPESLANILFSGKSGTVQKSNNRYHKRTCVPCPQSRWCHHEI